MRTARSQALAVAVAGLALVACGPRKPTSAGLKGVPTDIVLGAQTKPTDPAPPYLPGASPDPAFPGFLAPMALPQPGPLPSPTTTTHPSPAACPDAPVTDIPPGTASDVGPLPLAGVYPFRQTGFQRSADGKQTALAPRTERTLQKVTGAAGTDITYEVVEKTGGASTTTSYAVVRTTGAAAAGIYVTRTTRTNADGTIDDFAPVAPGLQIFALPGAVGTSFRSTATDPIHNTSMVLRGLVREKARVDACGKLVEGWGTDVSVHVEKSGLPDGGRTTRYDASYVVVPQLGGIVVAEKVVLSLTDPTDPLARETDNLPATTTTTNPALPSQPPSPDTTVPRVSPDDVRSSVEVTISRLTPVRPA